MTLVSVVIPLFNRRRYIVGTIESVLAQRHRDVEVLVVDDGSTDGSADLVASTFGERVRLVRLPQNVGRSAARNLGWEMARGELVAFLDSDDLWLPDKLSRQVDHFRDPSVVLVHCWVGKIDAEGKPLERDAELLAQEFARALERGYDYGGITETWSRLYTSAAVVRREALQVSGGFDPRLSNFEDWDVLWRIAKGGRVVTVPEPLVLHRTHPGNTTASWAEAAEPWLEVMRKHLRELQPTESGPAARRARHNLYLNMSLGEYWRRRHWASRWWMWRALLVDPRPLRNPGYYMWGAPLLNAFLPAFVADAFAERWHVDRYLGNPKPA